MSRVDLKNFDKQRGAQRRTEYCLASRTQRPQLPLCASVRLCVYILPLKILTLAATLFLIISPIASGEYKQVRPGKELTFPKALAAHPEYPLEWWYFTGHLEGEEGETFGFELTFFRVGVRSEVENVRRQSVLIGHFAVTDDQGQQFYYAEKIGRDNGILAGAATDTLQVWLGEWLVVLSDGKFQIRAGAEAKSGGKSFSLSLELESTKPPALHGDSGYSKKGPGDGEASYYISLTRLAGAGSLSLGDRDFNIVSAAAWMDHEIISFEPQSPEIGWQWFALQLEDNTELMLYYIYRGENVPSHYSKGSYINQAGAVRSLKLEEYSIRPTGSWRSARTGTVYPSGWEIEVPDLELALKVTPTLKDQEIVSTDTTGMTYWEGRCLVEGERAGRRISGAAYVELVGAGRLY